MIILALDTSHPQGSASLYTGDGAPDTRRFGSAASHLVEMGAAVKGLLEQAHKGAGEIDRVALVIGPGSFTGLRIGLAYAKGLYASLGVDIVVVRSLELLAMPLLEDHVNVCAMIDARKSEVYAAVYRRGQEPAGYPPVVWSEPQAVSPEELLVSFPAAPVVFVGSGAERFRGLVTDRLGASATFAGAGYNQPSTAFLCRLGERLAPLSDEDVARLEPYYIRPSDAKLSSLKRIRTDERSDIRPDE